MALRKDTLATGRDDTGEEDEMAQAQTVAASVAPERTDNDAEAIDAETDSTKDRARPATDTVLDHEAARNERTEPGPTWQKTG